ncbi:DUF305 domain-containing protein [Phytohabitans suffuscus]|uniref:DUF305 domain-containing protein n=1 Tax=Phytohabitans suffuscus TaxID=624315 RepID=A0A6F8YQG1_9ACTN|nr:DUF305 domain-containing protein [Phytohabitans suffuscus]
MLVLAAVLALAGCGAQPRAGGAPASEAPPPPPPSAAPATVDGARNPTDVMFLQMMLAHHEPAATLLELGRGKATRADVRGLAGELATAVAAETRTITGWLESWGEPLVSTAHADAHAAHGGLPALGDKEIAELGRTGGAEFDTAFLNLLIGHQHGAVELARMEATSGQNPQVKELAARTDEATRAQIQQLLRMVAG